MKQQTLAVFDLDQTLICGDSDNEWHSILIDQGLVDAKSHSQKKQDYYQQYLDYTLNIEEYLHFSMQHLTGKQPHEMTKLRSLIVEYIKPLIWQHSQQIINAHNASNHKTLLLTTTNHFISEPIATMLGMEILATKPDIVNGIYTGKPSGLIIEGKTKLLALKNWIKQQEQAHNLTDCYFYTDSYNDVELMNAVGKPIVVNPDKKLLEHGNQNNWDLLQHNASNDAIAEFVASICGRI